MSIRLAPSILSANFAALANEIAAAERGAIDELRARAARAAAAAAGKLIAAEHSAQADQALVDEAIAGI